MRASRVVNAVDIEMRTLKGQEIECLMQLCCVTEVCAWCRTATVRKRYTNRHLRSTPAACRNCEERWVIYINATACMKCLADFRFFSDEVEPACAALDACSTSTDSSGVAKRITQYTLGEGAGNGGGGLGTGPIVGIVLGLIILCAVVAALLAWRCCRGKRVTRASKADVAVAAHRVENGNAFVSGPHGSGPHGSGPQGSYKSGSGSEYPYPLPPPPPPPPPLPPPPHPRSGQGVDPPHVRPQLSLAHPGALQAKAPPPKHPDGNGVECVPTGPSAASTSAFPATPSAGDSRYGGFSHAPADSVMVTYLPGQSRPSVMPTMQSMGASTFSGAHFSSIDKDSAPPQILNAQLDFVLQARGGMLTQFVRCVLYLQIYMMRMTTYRCSFVVCYRSFIAC